MPTFSLVIPVFNVEGFLRECLQSVLLQSCQDFEAIVVEDKSNDNSLWVAKTEVGHHERFSIIEHGENRGLGTARNTGFDSATGDYVLFVDSDDKLKPYALERILERIERDSKPDLVLFDYERTYYDAQAKRNRRSELLTAAAESQGPVSVQQHPELLSLLQVVWTRCYRRDFLLSKNIRHSPGYYEDTPFTYPAMIGASKVSVIDEVLYEYRQRRSGNILRTQSRKHFDIFIQFDRLFEWLDSNPEAEGFRTFLTGRLTTHCITIMRSEPARIPPHDSKEFFHAAQRACRKRWEAVRYQPPLDQEYELQYRLVYGSYSDFKAALDASTRRSKRKSSHIVPQKALDSSSISGWKFLTILARRPLGKLKWGTIRRYKRSRRRITDGCEGLRRSAERIVYKYALEMPLKPRWAVFCSYWGRSFTCNPRAIAESMAITRPDIKQFCVLRDPDGAHIPANMVTLRLGSLRYFYVLGRSKILINNANFPNHFIKRQGSIFMQTHHGTPFKKMGLDMIGHTSGESAMNFDKLLMRSDNWDFVLSSNRHSTEVWSRAFPVNAEVLEIGYPRNDRLVARASLEVEDEVEDSVRKDLGVRESNQVFLYAPTFRDYSLGGRVPFNPNILADVLPSNSTLMIRHHYFLQSVPASAPANGKTQILDVSQYPDITDLCMSSDVLISDFSSLIADFLLLDRPVVLFAPDYPVYIQERGLELDVREFLPSCFASSIEDLADMLSSAGYRSPQARAERHALHARLSSFDNGDASKQSVDVLLRALEV